MKDLRLSFKLAPSSTLLWLAAAALSFAAACSDSATPPAECSPGLERCDGACVDFGVDVKNCGACGTACAEGQTCVQGACTDGCAEGQIVCGDACVDPETDAQHCGDCDTACAQDATCEAGACQGGEGGGCPEGRVDCGGDCVDTQFDRIHCGACGTTCASDERCEGGECQAVCSPGLTDCRGACFDTQTDELHCGGCDTACAPGQTCEAGICQSLGCGSGLSQCGDSCVDTATDEQNCGGCGAVCGPVQACQSGMCACTVGPGQDLGSTVPQVVTSTTAGRSSVFSPSCAAGASSSEFVYSFTAPSAGVYTFDSAGSTFDTVLSVVDASGCTEIACNDTAGAAARVSADLATGQTVFIVVDGAAGASGTFSLAITRPTPPACPAGSFGASVPQTLTGSTAGRPNSVVPACNATATPDAGYTFTASLAGDYVFDTFGSAFDTVLHVHNGTCSGPSLGCNDDTTTEQSQVTVTLAAGQAVVVVVDGFNGATGAFTLNVNLAPPPPVCDGSGVCGDADTGCVSCALTDGCSDELTRCTGDMSCINYVGCVRSCKTPACEDGCATTFPAGVPLYDAVLTCLYCTECPVDCADVGFTCP
jgi:Stigma-specific protein, Stig1